MQTNLGFMICVPPINVDTALMFLKIVHCIALENYSKQEITRQKEEWKRDFNIVFFLQKAGDKIFSFFVVV